MIDDEYETGILYVDVVDKLAYAKLVEGPLEIYRSRVLSNNILGDYDEDGNLIGIEFLTVSLQPKEAVSSQELDAEN